MRRRTWIGTGWKMNFLLADAEGYLAELGAFLRGAGDGLPAVFVVPPFTILRSVCQRARTLPLLVGAQNMHWEARGAYTGEISPAMVKDCGAALVELGHSERRAMYGETDAAVNRKVLAALGCGLVPLVCVGDTAEEQRLGVAAESVARQVKIALHGVPRDRVGDVVVAYEPVWAIGQDGTPASPEWASALHAVVREAIAALHGAEAADRCAVLYGGSVTPANAGALLAAPDVDGLFVGRAAWAPQGLVALVRIAMEARGRRAP
ncbi:triose-phosphate isomerase [Anaeromyxobacter oryzae]|uniref:Triosephosphate isomerase n=1 Tax=Anaeromyxobacter oryzae TaxID=2918170 RepID=A0ABM7WP99_9BACT|nr:triose-phosphate isomerase [Anaeromyxobacter oryzae]BDG01299.1 triosephosphate isomerase [Anaeromyxobacter oryzae]